METIRVRAVDNTVDPSYNRRDDGFWESSETPEQKARRLGVPVIKPLVPKPNPIVAVCGVCGRSIHQSGDVICGQPNCPIVPTVTCGSFNNG